MLNREAICSGAYLESFNSLPGDMLWTQAQIDASLASTMAQRPDSDDVWVFGYGSLMWNPISAFDERVAATLDGWHRSFCIRLIAGRASAAQPGRMLSLEPGGATEGVALRLPTAALDEELRILWIREMVTGAYTPTWQTVTLRTGERKPALAFVANPAQLQYERDSKPSDVAPSIARARGAIGSNAEYVFHLQKALLDCQIRDAYIDELVEELDRHRQSA